MKPVLFSAITGLLVLQMACATRTETTAKPATVIEKTAAAIAAKPLPTPEVAVMPTRGGVLVAWKPVVEADGYFVYRETQNPPAKSLLGIGPKESEGFIDRSPPENEAKYSVQAFKVSEISEKLPTTALPQSQESESNQTSEPETRGLPVTMPM